MLYTGGRNPLSLRVLWPTTGIQNQNNWFLGEGGRLYAATAKRGLVRIDSSGEPSSEYSRDVSDDTANWTMSNVVGGYDADFNRDVFGHAKQLLCFNPQREKWDTPVDLTDKITGNLCSCVPVAGGLLLAANDGTTIRLYTFNSGTGMLWEVFGEVHLSQDIHSELFQVQIALRTDTTNVVTFKIFVNGDIYPKHTRSITPSRVGKLHLPVARPNVRNARSHQVYLSQTSAGGDCGPDQVIIRGVGSNVISTEVSTGATSQQIIINFPPIADRFVDAAPFVISADVNSGQIATFAASGECTLVDHLDGTATVTLTGDAGVCSITASAAAVPGLYDAAPDVSRDFSAIQRSQTITFAPITGKMPEDPPFDISATASSGLTVSFSASGECSLVDHGDGTATVTLTGDLGACSVTASQAGNATYNAATNVVRAFTVSTLIAPTFDDTAGDCGGVLTYETIDGVVVITNPTGSSSGGYDRGLFGLEAITTIGAVEFQFIYTEPVTTGNLQFVALSPEKNLCNRPGEGLVPDPGPNLLARNVFRNGEFYVVEILSASWESTVLGAPDSDVEHTPFLSSEPTTNIYKFTLDEGVWRLYKNELLIRTFAYDLAGAHYLNVGSAWALSEVHILRFSNTEVF